MDKLYIVRDCSILNRITKTLGISIGELLQPNAIDIRNLYIEEKVKKVLIEEVEEDSKEKIDFINQQLNTIIISFLATISAYDCSIDKVESISAHLIEELQFIKGLKDCDNKAPAS
ncbi:hypothetical protein [Natronincola peptidivorans]|uniref:hypothetical protein n=1 Tax=Natronincola peptidivorans TaxID=426128 RepID=UPI0011144EA4|nr:hypothetical protein [Natronincola peptidivorans]